MSKLSPEEVEVYRKQFAHELGLLKKCGYEKYLLIVHDLIEWCKNNDILVGAGRGSVTGSIVAYLLNITTVDPIEHKLNFGRFINEGRIGQKEDGTYFATSSADIDIDFGHLQRPLVRKRLELLYGENKISGISTFQTLKSKAAVKSVAKVFGVEFWEVNKFCKEIKDDDIDNATKETSIGREFNEKYPHVIKHAKKLQGKCAAGSTHAAGLILSPVDLRDSDVAHLVRSKDGEKSINLSMEHCEDYGLIKLDALVLKTLDIIKEAMDIIKENTGRVIDIDNIDLHDEKLLKFLDSGKVTGLFQVGTYTGKLLIDEMGIDSFDELVASLALVRPGAKDAKITEEYILRKNGKGYELKHPEYEKITNSTRSLVIYQEQILEVLTNIAGLSMQISDKIRKIIGKKRDASEFEQYNKMFLDGCKKLGYFSQEEGEKFWEELQASASYSFSKNHSCAYAKITMQTTFLKYYYPAEFYAAYLTTYYNEKEKTAEIVKDVQANGYKIKTPKVGVSHSNKWLARDGILYMPFISCRGVGEKTAPTAQNHKKLDNGFFKIAKTAKGKEKKPKKLDKILDDLKAHSEENPSQEMLEKYFDFEIILDYNKKYPDLSLLKKNHYENETWGDLLDCKLPSSKIIRRKMKPKQYLRGLGVCDSCKLCLNCRKPIKPEFGKYNVMIVGESPSWVDDKYGVHKSNEYKDILFPTLKEAGFDESFFYKTNLLKCCLEKGSKIDVEKIEKCLKWLTNEIAYVKPNVVLAFGNGAMAVFKGEAKGIKSMNGKTEWNEKLGAWVCYCVRPGTAIWGGSEGAAEVEVGIRNFVRVCRNLGLDEKSY